MSNDVKISIGVIVSSIVLVVGVVVVSFLFDTPDQVDIGATTGEQRHVKGNPDASIVIAEFSDFQCPACKGFTPVLDRFMDTYQDQVKLVYRHFPLPQHANAEDAAIAAEAASRQGKFWEVHDWLFEYQLEWSEVEVSAEYFFDEFGEEFELNRDQFISDYNSDEVRELVRADAADARSLGVNATPTIYINGEKETRITSYDDLVSITGVVEVTPTVDENASTEETTQTDTPTEEQSVDASTQNETE